MCEYQPSPGLTGSVQLSHTAIKIPDMIQYLFSETVSFKNGISNFGRKNYIDTTLNRTACINRVITYGGEHTWTNSFT